MIIKIIKPEIISKIALIIILLFTRPVNIYSQVSDYSSLFYNAMNLYNEGKVDSAYNILSSCVNGDPGFNRASKSTRTDIYRLCALSALLLDKPDEAQLNIRRLLSYQPYYKDDFAGDDLSEFRKIVTGFTVQPKLVLGINYFIDFLQINIEKTLTAHNTPYIPEITSWSESGWGMLLENSFSKNIYAGIGLNMLYMSFRYNGSPLPFQQSFSYSLPTRYLESPVYAGYKLRINKKAVPYFQIGLIGRYPLNSGVKRLKSSEYGEYYLIMQDGNLAVFFDNYERLDLLVGSGIKYNFKKSCLDFNINYFPFHLNHNKFNDINTVDDLPQTEPFAHADEIILLDLKRRMRIELCYKYYFSFKAF
jgi:hypothetical protein